ncbi:hypothetical protein Acr_06g0007720 [Actinidia rufa]|uniref:Uncharacterized protein n=1 Tax=Actinidia rufa TaxID=165716 RepID=A0A7J0ER70_9ERIC|nr:hypothetical protein Acr_06g0007720 [Actinidia rufa]
MLSEFCPLGPFAVEVGIRQWEDLVVIPWKIVSSISKEEPGVTIKHLPRSHLLDIYLVTIVYTISRARSLNKARLAFPEFYEVYLIKTTGTGSELSSSSVNSP